MDRRRFLGATAAVVGSTLVGTGPWRHVAALGEPVRRGAGPYGPLAASDANGARLPPGFTSRVVATSGTPVVPGGYVWHHAPDGAACFAAADGGWILVSNAELGAPRGGAAALRFAATGDVVGGHRILDGTVRNCAGGATPWGTWLSCEEADHGYVYECDPSGVEAPTRADLLGRFVHEAAGVDAAGRAIYLTEDSNDGRLYRALPAVWPAGGRADLRTGRLQAAVADVEAALHGPTPLQWVDVVTSGPHRGAETARFRRGEGLWSHAGVVYFSTTADNRVWAIDTAASTLEVVYAGGAELRAPDSLTVAPSGELFVAEDGDDMQLVVLAAMSDGATEVAPFLQLVGHRGSEVAGPCFTPSGDRLYVTSQRGTDGRGVVFEISGPFTSVAHAPRNEGAAEPPAGPAPTSASPAPPPPTPPSTTPTTAAAPPSAPTTAPPTTSPRRVRTRRPATQKTGAAPASSGSDPAPTAWRVGAGAAATAAAAAAFREWRTTGASADDDTT